jgi:hypothetical protein
MTLIESANADSPIGNCIRRDKPIYRALIGSRYDFGRAASIIQPGCPSNKCCGAHHSTGRCPRRQFAPGQRRVASAEQITAAAALCLSLEGKTDRQRNPHAAGSLAWITWTIARLGGWNCYYKPPGPKTMRDGWQRFAAIAEGFALAREAQDV